MRAWSVEVGTAPVSLPREMGFLEKHLEDWVWDRPDLVNESVRWVARQLGLPGPCILDLLGFSGDGRWVVAELKRGRVGTSVVLQALHYFVELSKMTNGEIIERVRANRRLPGDRLDQLTSVLDGDAAPEFLLIVAGVGSGHEAEEAAEVFARAGLQVEVQVVTFALVKVRDQMVLMRDVDVSPMQQSTGTSGEKVFRFADELGQGAGLRELCALLEADGFVRRDRVSGFNFSGGSRRSTFWVRPGEAGLHIGYLVDNFPALYGVEPEEAEKMLGANWVDAAPTDAVETMKRWIQTVDGWVADREQ